MTDMMQVRVMVLDAWDELVLNLPATSSIADLKTQALGAAHVAGTPDEFLVKFRGAEISDETRTLADAKVPAEAALIVMRRRRVPVR